MSLYSALKKNARSQSLVRATGYVGKIKPQDFFSAGNTLTVLVPGTDLYQVTIFARPSGEYSAICTCPFEMGGYCKHILAAAQRADELIRAGDLPELSLNDVGDNEADKDAEIWRDDRKAMKPALSGLQGRHRALRDFIAAQTRRKDHGRGGILSDWQTLQERFHFSRPGTRTTADQKQDHQVNDYLVFALSFQKSYLRSEPTIHLVPYKASKRNIPRLSSHNTRVVRELLRQSPKYLSDLDWKILNLLNEQGDYGWTSRGSHRLPNEQIADIFGLLRGTDKLRDENGRQLSVSDSLLTARLQVTQESDGSLTLTPELVDRFQVPQKLGNSGIPLFGSHPTWLWWETSLYRLQNIQSRDQIEFLLHPHKIEKQYAAQLIEGIGQQQLYDVILLPDALQPVSISDRYPTPELYLQEHNVELKVELKLRYDPSLPAFPPSATNVSLTLLNPEGGTSCIARQPEAEQQLIRDLHATLPTQLQKTLPPDEKFALCADDAVDFVVESLPQLSTWSIFGQEQLDRYRYWSGTTRVNLQMRSEIDWFELEGELHFGEYSISLATIATILEKGESCVVLGTGEKARLPTDWLKQHTALLGLAENSGKHLKVNKWHAQLLDAFLEVDDDQTKHKQWRDKMSQLVDFKSLKQLKPPHALRATLRPYQLQGYRWMRWLRDNHFGGILADDMGLGKTVQTLSLLAALYGKTARLNPTLLVLPKSLIFNWLDELTRFAPSLTWCSYVGVDRKLPDPLPQIVLTTYGTARSALTVLRDIDWHYLILDESQNIKNPSSLTYKALRTLKSEHRLALTGTPVENSLLDLWAHLDLLNPGMLGSQKFFKQKFILPIQKEQSQNHLDNLHLLVRPFILRRTKEAVAPELKSKIEMTSYVELAEAQKKLYNQTKNYYRALLLEQIDTQGMNKSRFKILEGLLRLRQICCDPRLINPTFKGENAKLELLVHQLQEIRQEGHKALVFSQFASMLDLIEQRLNKEKLPCQQLTGKTGAKQRGKLVQRFQTDPGMGVFLISLKAGGTGLNLTAAEYVFHYDPWWNPAVERQATDRTHRIGQGKQVFGYKLIAQDTVEEKILKLQEKKHDLVKNIISADEGLTKVLSRTDVQSLFG